MAQRPSPTRVCGQVCACTDVRFRNMWVGSSTAGMSCHGHCWQATVEHPPSISHSSAALRLQWTTHCPGLTSAWCCPKPPLPNGHLGPPRQSGATLFLSESGSEPFSATDGFLELATVGEPLLSPLQFSRCPRSKHLRGRNTRHLLKTTTDQNGSSKFSVDNSLHVHPATVVLAGCHEHTKQGGRTVNKKQLGDRNPVTITPTVDPSWQASSGRKRDSTSSISPISRLVHAGRSEAFHAQTRLSGRLLATTPPWAPAHKRAQQHRISVFPFTPRIQEQSVRATSRAAVGTVKKKRTTNHTQPHRTWMHDPTPPMHAPLQSHTPHRPLSNSLALPLLFSPPNPVTHTPPSLLFPHTQPHLSFRFTHAPPCPLLPFPSVVLSIPFHSLCPCFSLGDGRSDATQLKTVT